LPEGMVTARAQILASVLRRIGGVDLKHFRGRLALQKQIYFLQVFGFYLGYRYSWYLYGPYSPSLTKDAFGIQDLVETINPIKFSEISLESRFEEFIKFFGPKRTDAQWLELISSVHFLAKLYPSWSRDRLAKRVQRKNPDFTSEKVEKAIEYLESRQLLTR